MNTGDLVMFHGSGIIYWVIRHWTRSAWGHVGVLWVCEGVPMVLEATLLGGVACHALSNRVSDGPTVYTTGKPIDVTHAIQHLGDRYSVKDAIRAGLRLRGDHAGWTCAEWAAALYGLPSGQGWTPQNLAQAVLVP